MAHLCRSSPGENYWLRIWSLTEVYLYQVAFISENQFSSFFFFLFNFSSWVIPIYFTHLWTPSVFYDNLQAGLLDCSTFHTLYNRGCLRKASAFLNDCYKFPLKYNQISSFTGIVSRQSIIKEELVEICSFIFRCLNEMPWLWVECVLY